jgi:glutathione S-transferase
MYKLYSIPGTCSTGITILLTQLGVEFETIKRDDVENYSQIVPTNQVPALEFDGQIITEGAAIILYLLQKHKNDILPQDTSTNAEFLQYLMFNYSTLHPAYSKIFAANAILEDSAEKTKLINELAQRLSATWDILDNRLNDQKYIVGDKPTVIDCLLAIYTSWNRFFPSVNVKLGKNIQRLVNEVVELPEFKAAYKKEEAQFVKTF